MVLLGPSHRSPFRGLAVPTVAAFATPLGELPIDTRARDALLGLSQIHATDAPTPRSTASVELPFLQTLLGSFDLLPIAAGDASAAEVAETLDAVWERT